ncbi:fructokinase [Chitinophaga dinghuensis]|uniref:Fructokinase n=1 Tax=Chitinophaga dinghuensis TaxID=1539050 RepID=A0A327WBQ3_9BACT|nr:carbohydrate kinase [Chitinophaga dinghuensis]RAJ87599.1 fructokinase [Chitinophaga dinghuensis]
MKTEIVCFGEVLWDILPDKELPGGAPMNVAYHLQKLHHVTAMVTRIGKDEYGERLLDVMRGYGLSTAYIQVDPTVATGKVLATVTPQQEMSYDILFPAAWDYITSDILWEALESPHPACIIFGSLASRNAVSKQALQALLGKVRGLRVLDVNLRPPHYSVEHITWLLEHADIVKMNEHELQELSGWYGLEGDMRALVRQLSDRFVLRAVLVTLGAKGCLLYEDHEFYQQPGHTVQVADTIGSGDALLAGYIHAMLTGSKPGAALRFGNALGALVAGKSGGCPDYETAEIITMMHQH